MTDFRPATECPRLLAFDRLVDHARTCRECRDRAGTGTLCGEFRALHGTLETTTCGCCPAGA